MASKAIESVRCGGFLQSEHEELRHPRTALREAAERLLTSIALGGRTSPATAFSLADLLFAAGDLMGGTALVEAGQRLLYAAEDRPEEAFMPLALH